MAQKLSEKAFAYSLAIVSAVCMLFMGIAGNLGFYLDAVAQMQAWHLFFDLTLVGIVTGTIEAALSGLVLGWAIAWVYNQFA